MFTPRFDYQKFLFWQRASSSAYPTLRRISRPIRDICGINDLSVKDFSLPDLTQSISSSLDASNNIGGQYVLAVIGDFRDTNPETKRTWSW